MADEIVMVPVTSSQIAAIGYDPETKVMRVSFVKNGALYEYQQVPEDVYQRLMAAPSVGSEFAAVKYAFSYERIG